MSLGLLFHKTCTLVYFGHHSGRAVSGQKGKKFFAMIKLAAARKHFVWKALQLDKALTINTLAVDDLWSMC